MKHIPVILSVAGSDSSCGAGIQADLKTITALGGYAATAITAVTAQNTLGVQAVYPLAAEQVYSQITAVIDDLHPVAIKIGMMANASIVAAIVQALKQYKPVYTVCDPVMISTSGRRLLATEAITLLQEQLFPLCTLVTPNLDEASFLYGHPIRTTDEMEQAALELSTRFHTAVLVKGGHLQGNEMCDMLCNDSILTTYTERKIDTRNLHGTGCTLSSAIATFLAKGYRLPQAVRAAKAYTSQAIERGKSLCIGQGNGPLGHFPEPE